MQLSIEQIKTILKQTEWSRMKAVLDSLREDNREGVIRLVQQYEKKLSDYRHELERMDQMMIYERKYRDFGIVSGMDEAGRGPLAGPVVASCVVLPMDHPILYLNDSKQLSEKKREELYDVIMREAVSVGVGIRDEKVIDEINILQATYEAMYDAFSQIEPTPSVSLNDAVKVPKITVRQVPIIKGDCKSASIAAASIIAKVTRDRMMKEYDLLYPEYGFASHKGYGCASHIEAIKKYGPCPIHRRTFIRNFTENE